MSQELAGNPVAGAGPVEGRIVGNEIREMINGEFMCQVGILGYMRTLLLSKLGSH